MTLRERLANIIGGQPRADAKISFRADAQYRLPGEIYQDTSAAQAPPEHYTPLYDAVDHDNSSHREARSTYDPHAYLWTYVMAYNVFDDWFEFIDPESNEQLEEMDVVQERFRELRMKEALTIACAEERKHGFAVIYKVYSGSRNRTPEEEGMTHFMGDPMAFTDSPAPAGRDILAIQPLPTIDTRVDRVDILNQPEIINYTSSIHEDAPVGAQNVNEFIHASRCWIISPRSKDRTWIGPTSLEPIWEVLYTLQQHLDSMTFIAQKWGFGMTIIEHQGDLTSTEADRMDAVMKAGSKRRHLMIDPNMWKINDYLQPNISETGLPQQIDILYGMLASGTGLPKTRWIGAQAGDLTASRTNLKLEYGCISAIQSTYDPIIRNIIEDLFPGQFREYKIKWRLEYQMDELEEATVLQTTASALNQISPFISLKEGRKMLKLSGDLTPEETVSAIQQSRQLEASKELGKGLQAIGGKPSQQKPSAPTEPTRADAKAAVEDGTFPRFVEYWRGEGWSNNKMIRHIGFGKGRFYELLRKQEVRRDELHL